MSSQPTKFRQSDFEGDWVCADSQCGNLNFARRTSCNRCGKEKSEVPKKLKLGTEIGKAAAEKSGGLFSADDWQCSKCGNVNWARRQQCNMCNAPKFGEVEERTGYGGGYNERENVEYIERDESDGEYDEFGRKKKKFRGKDASDEDDDPVPDRRCKQPVVEKKEVVVRTEEEVEDDDDDDDEDDGGDLSKYDLTGWSDVEDNANDAASNNHKLGGGGGDAKKRSASSSRSQSSSPHRSSKSERSRSPSSLSRSSSGRRGSSKRSRSRSRSSSSDTKSRRRQRTRSRERFRSRSRSDSKSHSPSHRRR